MLYPSLPKEPTDPSFFSALRTALVSPDKICEWSRGEVKEGLALNFRTFMPVPDGLFCPNIFGHEKNNTQPERFGHIALATPVAHPWHFKNSPNRIGAVLGSPRRSLEEVLYHGASIVIDPKQTNLVKGEVLRGERYEALEEELGAQAFTVSAGGEAILKLLRGIDLQALGDTLRKEIHQAKSAKKSEELGERLRICEALQQTGHRPEWLMLSVVPVLPVALRPWVRGATKDLNDLYRRLINNNNRLKRILDEPDASEFVLGQERRMLQASVDAVYAASWKAPAITELAGDASGDAASRVSPEEKLLRAIFGPDDAAKKQGRAE